MATVTRIEKSPEQLKAEREAEFKAARAVYLTIMGIFFTICVIAVVVTTQIESHKTGFKAITTAQPMSFIDRTYMDKSKQ